MQVIPNLGDAQVCFLSSYGIGSTDVGTSGWAAWCAVSRLWNGGFYLLVAIFFALEIYLLMDICAKNDDAVQKQGTVLLWTWHTVVLCEVTTGNNFLMGSLGQLDGTNHGDFLWFLNYLKPQSEGGGKLLIGNKRN